jgi:tyrosine-protein phosphatase SIW14
MKRFLVVFTLFAAAILVVAILLMVRAAPEDDIVRFSMVADGLYRGGQPTAAGFEYLKANGVKTIVNLRAEDNSESQLVQALGMHYVQIPVDEVWPWSQLPEQAIARYFALVNNPANYPIFFHCRRGADRTGALAAMYRIAVQGWDASKAYEEALNIGMRWYFRGLKWQIYEFQLRIERTKNPPIR